MYYTFLFITIVKAEDKIVMKLIIAALIFGLLIVFHEYGHFFLARKNGIKVDEFCIGLGPTLFKKNVGDTSFSLKLFPVGGACIMRGEDESSNDERAFCNKSVWQRMSVIIAGPLFNIILALIFSFCLVSVRGIDRPIINNVSANSIAEDIGLRPGDRILSINGTPITIFREIGLYLQIEAPVVLEIKYERNGNIYCVQCASADRLQEATYMLGVSSYTYDKELSLSEVFNGAVYEIKYWGIVAIKSLEKLISGEVSIAQLSGPIGIVNTIGTVYDASIEHGLISAICNMINIAIMLSVNLGVMNLLPIPALDGGRLLFCILELIRGKSLDAKKENVINFVGFIMLMLLMCVVMISDITKIVVHI